MRKKYRIKGLRAYTSLYGYHKSYSHGYIGVVREDGERLLVIRFLAKDRSVIKEYYRSPIIAWTKEFNQALIDSLLSGYGIVFCSWNIPLRVRTNPKGSEGCVIDISYHKERKKRVQT